MTSDCPSHLSCPYILRYLQTYQIYILLVVYLRILRNISLFLLKVKREHQYHSNCNHVPKCQINRLTHIMDYVMV